MGIPGRRLMRTLVDAREAYFFQMIQDNTLIARMAYFQAMADDVELEVLDSRLILKPLPDLLLFRSAAKIVNRERRFLCGCSCLHRLIIPSPNIPLFHHSTIPFSQHPISSDRGSDSTLPAYYLLLTRTYLRNGFLW